MADDRTIVNLPSLGADMDVGTVIEWRVAVGDRVERGDVVAVVSTEKSDIDVESWDSGEVVELLAPLDVELEVGHPLIALAGDRPDTARAETEPPMTTAAEPPPVRGEPEPPPPASVTPAPPTARAGDRDRVGASPYARRLAAERGIDLTTIVGSGPGGAVLAADLDGATTKPVDTAPAASAPPASPAERMRRVIADRMSRANRDIPHYHLDLDIDMTAALEWLAAHNEPLPIAERVVPAALLACATAQAAARVPQLNGTWPADRFEPAEDVSLGVVVSLRKGGIVAPTVPDADQVGADEMMNNLREMVTEARKGQLRSRWMKEASITLTNLGEQGADRVAGIVFPPQVALVGFGRIVARPWVVDGTVMARPIVTATLAADHRASDGADGSRFLAEVAKALADPAKLST